MYRLSPDETVCLRRANYDSLLGELGYLRSRNDLLEEAAQRHRQACSAATAALLALCSLGVGAGVLSVLSMLAR